MNGRMFQITPDGTSLVSCIIINWFGKQTYTVMNDENREISTNWVFRAQWIPYDWVPEDTPRSENPVKKLDVTEFRITE